MLLHPPRRAYTPRKASKTPLDLDTAPPAEQRDPRPLRLLLPPRYPFLRPHRRHLERAVRRRHWSVHAPKATGSRAPAGDPAEHVCGVLERGRVRRFMSPAHEQRFYVFTGVDDMHIIRHAAGRLLRRRCSISLFFCGSPREELFNLIQKKFLPSFLSKLNV